MKMVSLALAAVLFTSSPVGAFNLIGPGTQGCGTWMSVKGNTAGDLKDRQYQELVLASWLLGFLSGFNTSVTINGGADILEGISYEALTAWMDNFCAANPLDDISDGAAQLTYELVQRARR